MTLTAMPKYETYKDSGVEWIGDIPAHWNIKKLKYISNVNNQTLPENTPADFSFDYVDIGSVTLENGIEKVETFLFSDAPSRARRLAKQGDTVVSTVRTYLKAISYVDRKSSEYIYSTGFAVINPKDENSSKYLTHFIKSDAFTNQVDDVAKGISYPAINSSELSNLLVVEPSTPEKNAIADFLDEKTAKIDDAIAIKERQIELLNERKQILIQQAVTQGLDPTVPMKNSGVAWIGKIPAHWEVRRSKFVFCQRKERARAGDVQLSATQAYGVIPQEQYEEMIGRKVVKISFHLEKRKHVEIDDFVISMRSFQGGLERAWASGCIRSSYVVLRPVNKDEIDAGFFSYMLKLPTYINALQMTASFIRDGQDLNFDNFAQVDLFVPPIEEQQAIFSAIQSKVNKINKSIVLLMKQITKYQEYKTTLINSAVTGKIKVV